MDTKTSLVQTADEILMQLARNQITHSDPLVKIAIFIKETFPVTDVTKPPLRFAPFKKQRPVMLETCIDVYEYMVNNGVSFSSATSDVADMRHIKDSTVRQACCSNLGLVADDWNQFYNSNYKDFLRIISKLLIVYPDHESYIIEHIK